MVFKTCGFKQTQIGMLPLDWEVKRFPEIVTEEKGSIKMGPFGSQIKKEDLTTEGVHLIGIENVINNDYHIGGRFINQKKFETLKTNEAVPGDVVITTMGTVGLAGVIPKDIPRTIIDSHLIRIRINTLVAMPEFVMILIQDSEAVKKQILRMSQGGIMAGLNTGIIKSLLLSIPPLREQRKIVEIITSVDDTIEKTEAIIKQTEKVKKGLMDRLLTKGIGHNQFKQTDIGEIPEEWDVVRLDEVATVERGKFSHRPRNDPKFYGGSIPFVQTGDVTKANGYLESHSQTLNELGLSVSRMFPAGTIILTIAANIGETAIARYDVCFPDSLVGILPNERVDTHFLEYMLRAKKEFLDSSATQSAQKNINLQTLKPLQLPLPKLDEQKRISKVLMSIEDKIRKEKECHDKLVTLKKGLMQSLLTGKVRVKLDEPEVVNT